MLPTPRLSGAEKNCRTKRVPRSGLFPSVAFRRFLYAGREIFSAWGTFSVRGGAIPGRESQKRGRRSYRLERTGGEAVFAVAESLFQLIFKSGGKTGRNQNHKRRQKPRNHPANPVGGPDLPCITLPGVFRSVSGGTHDLTERRTLFTFSHFGQRSPCVGGLRMVPGLFCRCIYYTTHFSDVKLVWPNFWKKV